MKHTLLQILGLFSLLCSQAQQPVIIKNEKLDIFIGNLKDSLCIPGISAGIAQNGQIVYLKSFGYSDLNSKTPLSENDVWPICSVSKQFVAVSCQLLVQEGKLNLDKPVEAYLRDIPASWNGITIRQLLTHTSGIKDYLNKDLYGKEWEQVMADLSNDTLDFTPGTKWNYSNSGFWLAARIVERITDLHYEDYLNINFFVPLELKQTKNIASWSSSLQKVQGHRYDQAQTILSEFDLTRFKGQGDGDIISTINDLLRWEIALAHYKILNKQMFHDLLQTSRLKNGDNVRFDIPYSENAGYGIGWFNKKIDGSFIYWTPGSLDGYSTSVQYIPDYDLHIIVFCNRGGFLLADGVGFEIVRELIAVNK